MTEDEEERILQQYSKEEERSFQHFSVSINGEYRCLENEVRVIAYCVRWRCWWGNMFFSDKSQRANCKRGPRKRTAPNWDLGGLGGRWKGGLSVIAGRRAAARALLVKVSPWPSVALSGPSSVSFKLKKFVRRCCLCERSPQSPLCTFQLKITLRIL